MLFLVFDAKGRVIYEGDNWPVARSALDCEIIKDENCPVLVITPEPDPES